MHSSSCESYRCTIPGFIFITFSTAQSPRQFRSICNFYMSLPSMIFLYIIQSSAKSPIVDSMFLQISLTYTRNRWGPNSLPCGTPDITLTSSHYCPPTLTFCKRPKMNSLTHKTTLESTPEAIIFVISQSWGTESKAFEKSIIITSILAPSSKELAKSWQNCDYLTFTWVSQSKSMLAHI